VLRVLCVCPFFATDFGGSRQQRLLRALAGWPSAVAAGAGALACLPASFIRRLIRRAHARAQEGTGLLAFGGIAVPPPRL